MGGKCQFCGLPATLSKQWAPACSGCKTVLNRLLRSGDFGDTYDSAHKRLMGARYDWGKAQWIIPEGE
jgi:hypothetical protein